MLLETVRQNQSVLGLESLQGMEIDCAITNPKNAKTVDGKICAKIVKFYSV